MVLRASRPSRGENEVTMNVRVISAYANERFQTMWAEGDAPSNVDQHLEQLVQQFLDEHPGLALRQVSYGTTAIVPNTGQWGSTHSDIGWIIEKSVLIFYD